MDEETRKDDKLMERMYKGRAEEKMMLGADGQRAGGRVTGGCCISALHLGLISIAVQSAAHNPTTAPLSLSVCSCMCVHLTDAASIYGTVFAELPTKALVSYATTDRMFSKVNEITPFDDVHLHFEKGDVLFKALIRLKVKSALNELGMFV